MWAQARPPKIFNNNDFDFQYFQPNSCFKIFIMYFSKFILKINILSIVIVHREAQITVYYVPIPSIITCNYSTYWYKYQYIDRHPSNADKNNVNYINLNFTVFICINFWGYIYEDTKNILGFAPDLGIGIGYL